MNSIQKGEFSGAERPKHMCECHLSSRRHNLQPILNEGNIPLEWPVLPTSVVGGFHS